MGPTYRRKDNSKYYHVNESREAFISFFRWKCENDKESVGFSLLSTEFSRLMLNRQFVVDALRERGVVFKMPEMTFPPGPGDDLARQSVITPCKEKVWSLPVLGRYPKRFEDAEEVHRVISELGIPFPLYQKISKKKRYIDENDLKEYSEKIQRKPESQFPLRMENEKDKIQITDDDIDIVNKMNPGKFEDDLHKLILQGYYENYQEEHIILPILCLIRNSPSALFEFLFSDWTKKRNIFRSGSLIEPIEAVLFRMVFRTVSDILDGISLFSKDDSTGDLAYFGTTEMSGEKISSLLTLRLRDGRKIVYEGGFTTDVTWLALNDEDVIPIISNDENSSIRTKVTGERYDQRCWPYLDDDNVPSE